MANEKKILLEKGQIINSRYEVVGQINEGASGQVFFVNDITNQKADKKALKIIPASNNATRKEIDILAKLTLSDNIAKILDYGTINANGTLATYIVMDYYKLGEISNLTSDADYQILSNQELIHYLKQTLRGLQNLHENSEPIIHKDVKPGNLLVDDNKDVFFSDFGISMFAEESRERQRVNGTAKYMAPESRYHNEDSQTTKGFGLDIFALGIIFYKFATGVMPQVNYKVDFVKDDDFNTKQINEIDAKNLYILDLTIWEEMPNPKVYNPLLNDDLDKIISKMIVKDPNKRYKSATDIINDIKTLESGKKVKAGNVSINEIPSSAQFKDVEKEFYVYRLAKFLKTFNWWWFLAIASITLILVIIFIVVVLLV